MFNKTYIAFAIFFTIFVQFADASPIKVSDNGRSFNWNNGSPFFWLADSAQALAVRLSREDVDLYLQNRAALGFNVIKTDVISFIGFNAPNFYGDRPFLNGDPSLPNESFWQHLDYIVNKAGSLGLIIGLVPDRSLIIDNFNNGAPGRLNESTASLYGRYLGTRYAGKSVVWVLGWDVDPSRREAVFAALADGIEAGAGGTSLITFHPSAAPWVPTGSSSYWFHNHSWLDFNSVQSGHTDNNESYGLLENHATLSADYALFPAKPTLDMEPAYENTPTVFG